MPIYFYTAAGEYGCLSNFSRHGFELGGCYWPTAEHYFQAQKFAGTDYEMHVARASTAKEALTRGRVRTVPLRADWEAVKDVVMRAAVGRKFETHADIRAVLLGTGDEALVENAPGYYWGCGADGTGLNRLGQILMDVRARLRRQEAEPSDAPDGDE